MFILALLGITLIIGYFTSAHFVGMLFKWTGSICLGIGIVSATHNDYYGFIICFIGAVIFWTIGGKITNEYPKRGSEDELLK